MQKPIVEFLSFGNRFLFASFLYLGLGLLVLGIAPSMPTAHAGPDIECEEGMTPVLVGEVYECQCAQSEDGDTNE